VNADPRNGNARLAPGGTFGSASGGARRADDTGPLDFQRIAADALQRADAVLSRWLPDGRRQGSEWVARNPTRTDTKPGSFSVNTVTGRWCDFATGDKCGDLVALVAMLDGTDQATAARALAQFLGTGAAGPIRQAKPAPTAPASKPRPPDTAVAPVPADAPAPPDRHPAHGAPSAVWAYRDAAGAVLFRVCRFDPPEGRKEILPQSLHREPEGLRWRWKGLPTPRPLYGLDRLAAAPELPVVVCEGEKAADAAARLLPGWVAVTSPNGSAGAGSADWGPLAGRRCVIWPDADPAGAGYAADVQRLALAAGATGVAVAGLEPLALIRGADLPQGFDAADAEGEGLDAEALAGWLAESLEAPADHAEELAEEAPDPAEGTQAENGAADPLAGLPCFRIIEWTKGHRNGVHWCGIAKDKETGLQVPAPPVWICDPLLVTALTRDDRGHEWGRLLEWRDADNRGHQWAMPCELLAGSGEELRAALLRRGLAITSGGARSKLGDYLSGERPTVRARSVTRTGWSGGAFVWPDHTEGDTAAEPVVLQLASADGVETGQAGTLEGWRQEVAGPCAGNSRLVLALSAALAAPTLAMLRAEGGGLHYRGSSSVGKSTALYAAASVYGPPSYLRRWRATGNALEAVAQLHNDALLVLDELGELANPKEAGQIAYMLANGQGKSRAGRDGSARASARWRLLFLSSGEIGLADLAAEGGGKLRAGQELRMLDLPADAGAGLGLFDRVPAGMAPGRFADALTDAAGRHYGTAGRAWVKYLVQHHAEARDALRELRDGIAEELAPAAAAGQVRRAAGRFALIAAAGEVATAAGITGWSQGEAEGAAAACFRAWLGQRGTAGAAEPVAMLRQVRQFLEVHGEARFTALDDDPKRDTINRAGFRRTLSDGTAEFLILGEVWRGEVCRGFDPTAVAAAVAAAGALKLDSEGGRTRVERLPGIGRQRVHVITAALWGAAP